MTEYQERPLPAVADILAGKAKKKLRVSERPSMAVAYALATALAETLKERPTADGFQTEVENAIVFADKNLPAEVAVLLAKLLVPLPIKWGSPALWPIMKKWMTMLDPGDDMLAS